MALGKFMIESHSPRWCYSSQQNNERQSDQPFEKN